MDKILKLTLDEFQVLENARTFAALPSFIKQVFQDERIYLTESATVLDNLKASKWYIIDESQRFLRLFLITRIDSSNQGVRIKLKQETPTYSDNINDYPIYKVGIPFTNIHITGQERERLRNSRQLEKWDYFFRVSQGEIGHKHRQITDRYTHIKEKYGENLINDGLKVGGLLLGCLSLFGILWSIIALSLSIYLCVKFKDWFVNLYYTYRNLAKLQQSIQQIEEEENYLKSKVDQTNVSVHQMTEWLEEEIKELDQKAVQELNLPEAKIIRRNFSNQLDANLDLEQSILGLKIQEYGFVQPLSTNGKKKIEKKHPFHLLAYKHKKGKALVGVYYIYFIYMTPEIIGVSGYFYDFILAKRFGKTTTQYYYRDIVSIGTATEDTKVFSNQEEWETEQVKFSFYSGERISIALTDKVAIENLREQIEEKGKDTSDTEIDNADLDQLMEASDDELPGTKARFIVETVKTYWNQKKNVQLPPTTDTGLLS